MKAFNPFISSVYSNACFFVQRDTEILHARVAFVRTR